MLPQESGPSPDRRPPPMEMLGFLAGEEMRLEHSDPETSRKIKEGLEEVNVILNEVFALADTEGWEEISTLDIPEADDLVNTLFATYILRSDPDS